MPVALGRSDSFTYIVKRKERPMAKKLKNPQSLSIIFGGGIVAITVAGFVFALGGVGLPFAGEIVAGAVGMLAGAKVA
jgi:hypothetical protein